MVLIMFEKVDDNFSARLVVGEQVGQQVMFLETATDVTVENQPREELTDPTVVAAVVTDKPVVVGYKLSTLQAVIKNQILFAAEPLLVPVVEGSEHIKKETD